MFWIILISVLLLTLFWILVGPVIIYLDTSTNRYQLALPGIFKVMIVPGGQLFRIRARIFFIPFSFDPFRARKRDRKRRMKPGKRKRRTGPKKGMKLGTRILRSFRIRKLHLDVDTDDFVLNTQLVPVFSAINGQNIRMTTNFEGEASLLLDLRTRLGSLIWAFMTTR